MESVGVLNMKMKTQCLILMALVACLASCGTMGQTKMPPSSPCELGDRVAKALVTGNTNLIEACLPPPDAYLRAFAMSATIDKPSDAEMQKYYEHMMNEMREYVHRFPTDVEKETKLRIAEIRETVVDVATTNAPFTDVILTFRTGTSSFQMRLDECMQYSNQWYLIDFDWIGEEKSSEPSVPGDA